MFDHIERMKTWQQGTNAIDAPIAEFGTVSPRSINTSTTRIMSVTSKRSLTPVQTQALVNPKSNMQVYLETLKAMQEKAYKIRAAEREKEAALVEYLPVNERFNMNKEGKVLTRWQERQKGWSKIQASLAKKLKSRTDSLLMATTDEFRAKAEEYDILQAAIPPHEKYGINNWEMQLRGGGTRSAHVGHIFSGLYCPVKDTVAIPVMVRKPRTAPSNTNGNNHETKRISYVDETPFLAARRKRLEKYIKEIRPHSMNIQDVEGLEIKTMDLFEWAQKSSKQYFEKLQKDEREKAAQEAIANSINDHTTQNDESVSQSDSPASVASLEFSSPREIVFVSEVGDVVHQTVTFKNIGSGAVSYNWKVLPEKNQTLQVSEIQLLLEGHGDRKKREYLIAKERSSFFCTLDQGQILPGETVASVFTFTSRPGGGVLSQTWALECVPRCSIVLGSAANSRVSGASVGGSSTGAAVASNPIPPAFSPLHLKLRGHAHSTDHHLHRRDAATSVLEQLRIRSFCTEIVTDCVYRVRSPVTIPQLLSRQIRLLRSINDALLSSLSNKFTSVFPLYITTERFNDFLSLQTRLKEFIFVVNNRYQEVLEYYEANDGNIMDLIKPDNINLEQYKNDIERFQYTNSYPDIRSSLFPEKILVNFNFL